MKHKNGKSEPVVILPPQPHEKITDAVCKFRRQVAEMLTGKGKPMPACMVQLSYGELCDLKDILNNWTATMRDMLPANYQAMTYSTLCAIIRVAREKCDANSQADHLRWLASYRDQDEELFIATPVLR